MAEDSLLLLHHAAAAAAPIAPAAAAMIAVAVAAAAAAELSHTPQRRSEKPSGARWPRSTRSGAHLPTAHQQRYDAHKNVKKVCVHTVVDFKEGDGDEVVPADDVECTHRR